MSLAASRTQLATVTRQLAADWERTKESWRDTRSQEFEAKYLEPLHTQVTAALTAMEKLDALIASVRSDCE